MRKYRIISALLITCILTMNLALIPREEYEAYVAENDTQNMVAIIENQEKNRKIDQLLSVRSELELEYEKNIVLINQIDKQLEALGVEEITTDEVRSKMGQSVMPRYSVSSTSTTKWTSRRTVVAYANKQFELQIIEGVPISPVSPLREDNMKIQYKKSGFAAGTVAAMKVVGVSALGAAPEIGTVLSVGVTAYDVFKAYINNLKTSTVIKKVEGAAMVSLTGHMKYIFVKPYGSADRGNQVLCYVGNKVDYLVTTISTVDSLVNGVSTPIHKVEANKQDSSKSKNYSNYTLPAKNYYDYITNGKSNFVYDYQLTHITFDFFGQTKRMAAPSEAPNISY